ncbi:MAG: MATE family efflux transporter [Clostridia bacterium]|nr:MATE family efflux transporter [Clostridia bacterium]
MEQERKVPQNKMGTLPVPKLLMQMSLPMVISMLVQALYNVVDSIYVSHISENALTAVSLAFPVQNLMIAVACGVGVGMNALLSRCLGKRDYDGANSAAEHGGLLMAIGTLLFVLFGFFGAGFFFQSQTNIAEIVEGGTVYIRICCIASFGIFFEIFFERLLQSTGKTFYSMIAQGAGAILNIILDPILIFGIFGIPGMGIAGAALATVIGQIAAMLVGLYLHHRYNDEVLIKPLEFRLHRETIATILQVGIPSMLMMAIGSVMSYGLNRILFTFSATAVAVFGAYFKLQSFVFMPVFGMNNGIVPIIAYNYGYKRPDRIKQTMKLGMGCAIGYMTLGTLAFLLIPDVLLGFFDASPELLAIGVPALRTICLCFPFAAFSIVAGSVFQALGNGVYSLVMSVCRQLVVLLPVAYLLAQLGNVDLVWLSYPIAEVASGTLCAIFLIRIFKQKLKPMEVEMGEMQE